MLFINISSDKVQIADAKQEKFLDRNSIESTLGKTLVDRYRQSPFQDILLINGPGGFTNLRVGTLTLNLLNKLLASEDILNRQKNQWNEVFLDDWVIPTTWESVSTNEVKWSQISKAVRYKSSVPPPLQFYSITKFDLYSHLHKAWFLPQNGLIYIGQRDNVRLFDAEKKTYEQIKMDAIEKNNQNLFFDYVKEDYRGENTPGMLNFHMTEKWLEVRWNKNKTLLTIADLGIQAHFQVKPEYMIEAVN